MNKHHLIINGCHIMDFLLFRWHYFFCCCYSRSFGEYGWNPGFDDINMSFNFSSISPLNETMLLLNSFSMFASFLFFCWFKNRTSIWSYWIFLSKSTWGIYLFGMYLLLIFDFDLSALWVIVVRCLRNTWHSPHPLTDFGIKSSQFIIRFMCSCSLFPRHIWNSKQKSKNDCTFDRFIYAGNLETYVDCFHIVF